MVQKRSVLGLNSGCTVRRGKAAWLKRKNPYQIRVPEVRKVLLLPDGSKLSEKQVSQTVSSPNLFAFDDGGLCSDPLPMTAGQQPVDAVYNRYFDFPGMYSLNRRKRWLISELVEQQSSLYSDAYKNQRDSSLVNSTYSQASSIHKSKSTSKSKKVKADHPQQENQDVRIVVGTWPFLDAEAGRFVKVGASSYCDSHAADVVAFAENRNLRLSMRSLSHRALLHNQNSDGQTLKRRYTELERKPELTGKKVSAHHNKHFRGVQRPEKWKLEKAAIRNRSAKYFDYSFIHLSFGI